MTSLTDKARKIFALDRYATEVTGVAIDELAQHRAVCQLTLMPQHRNALGGVMGGVMFTLADLAFAAAANSDNIEHDEPLAWVSSQSMIHYLSQPHGDTLKAVTECVKHGKQTSIYLIHISDSTDRQVAIVTTTGTRLH